MDVKVREAGSVRIVDVAGRFTIGNGVGSLQETVREVLRSGHNKVLLNLRDVEMIDSAGLGELKRCKSCVEERDGILHLVKPRKEMAFKPVVITNLVVYFRIFDDELAAVGAFASEGASADAAVEPAAGSVLLGEPLRDE
jgi:anti-anti-sigma factor